MMTAESEEKSAEKNNEFPLEEEDRLAGLTSATKGFPKK
jgi:hypothetical protein